ncbi:MAG TPA: histidine kinase [Verrucomicrobiae bacterium]|nr:histidine kinase [Verrucomicrobiae bacterium]
MLSILFLAAPLLAVGELLTNTHSIITLPAERAALLLPVKVTGSVTAADPSLKGRFFVQDATGGVFVDNANGRRPEPGELVEVTGITHPGAYAPTITAPTVRTLGRGTLPRARPVSVDQLMSGAEDSQRIEITGIVRDARLDGARLDVDLVTGGYRYTAHVPVPPGYRPGPLVGSEVRARGTAAEAHNRSLRQLIAVELYIPSLDDLVVTRPETLDPFARPVTPLAKLAQYQSGNSLAQRVHIHGVVLLQIAGNCAYVQDSSGALPLQSRQPVLLPPGQIVDAVGFLGFENYLPVLQDVSFRAAPLPVVPLQPRPATLNELQNGLYRADYISLTGRLIERTATRGPAALVLQNSNVTFTATAADPRALAGLAEIPIGSALKVSGICLTEIDADGKLKTFQILLRDSQDIQILARPTWLTPHRLIIGVAVLACVLILIGTWTVILSRKNAALRAAQGALQQSNDNLEQRVQERTAQLKFQITAREEAEVRFKAILSERTRLAQELHDTVEQTLTGISFQLDTAAKLRQREPDNSSRHIEVARALMTKSQEEMRQSVWDLRSRALEQFDLARALLESARQSAAGTPIKVQLDTSGEPFHLPEVTEENLLRIGQEACANAVKHSRATAIRLHLAFTDGQVILEIRDDGCGFDPATAPGPRESHFGLLGLSERAKRLGARLSLATAPGAGCAVRVEVPLSQIHEETRQNSHSCS